MATKPGKMMIYLDGLANLKSHDLLIMSLAMSHDKIKPLRV